MYKNNICVWAHQVTQVFINKTWVQMLDTNITASQCYVHSIYNSDKIWALFADFGTKLEDHKQQRPMIRPRLRT